MCQQEPSMDLAEILHTSADKKIELVRFEQELHDEVDRWERARLFGSL